MIRAVLVTAAILLSQQAVDYWCHEYDIPYAYGAEIARLESNWDPQAMGDEGEAIGLFQFHPATWRWARKKMGLDPSLNIRLSQWESARTWAWLCHEGHADWWTAHEKALANLGMETIWKEEGR